MCMFFNTSGLNTFFAPIWLSLTLGSLESVFCLDFFVATSELSLHCSLKQCVANQLIITLHSIIRGFFLVSNAFVYKGQCLFFSLWQKLINFSLLCPNFLLSCWTMKSFSLPFLLVLTDIYWVGKPGQSINTLATVIWSVKKSFIHGYWQEYIHLVFYRVQIQF